MLTSVVAMSGTLHVHILLCHLAHLCMFLRTLLLLLLLGLGCVLGLWVVQLGSVLGLLLPAFCGLLFLRLVWMHVGVGLLVVFVSGVLGTGGVRTMWYPDRPAVMHVQVVLVASCLCRSPPVTAWGIRGRTRLGHRVPQPEGVPKVGFPVRPKICAPVSEVESGVNFRPAGRVRG